MSVYMHVYVGLSSRYVDSIGVLLYQCLWTMVSPVLSDSGVLIIIIKNGYPRSRQNGSILISD